MEIQQVLIAKTIETESKRLLSVYKIEPMAVMVFKKKMMVAPILILIQKKLARLRDQILVGIATRPYCPHKREGCGSSPHKNIVGLKCL